MHEIAMSSRFQKDLKLAHKRGYDLSLLDEAVERLAGGTPLEAKYRDHELSGDYAGFRERHIEPDWLLVYRIEKQMSVLFLSRTGTHSDLFG